MIMLNFSNSLKRHHVVRSVMNTWEFAAVYASYANTNAMRNRYDICSYVRAYTTLINHWEAQCESCSVTSLELQPFQSFCLNLKDLASRGYKTIGKNLR